MNKEVLLSALSTLTGATVKPISEYRGTGTPEELTIHNLVSYVLNEKVLRKFHVTVTKLIIKYEYTYDSEDPTKSDTAEVTKPVSDPEALTKSKDPDDATTDDDDDDDDDDDGEMYESDTAGLRKELFVNLNNFFEPRYDYDFRNLPDNQAAAQRGDYKYTRPCGWYRSALKVLDKYPDGNTWLGTPGWRNTSAVGEWPVSYQGTTKKFAEDLIMGNDINCDYLKKENAIVSTPNVATAGLSGKYHYNGKNYHVILQNRINPSYMKIEKKRHEYWLIPLPENGNWKEMIKNSLRPYGVLIKEF